MNWPTSQDYNEAVQDPAMSFADPGLRGGEVVVNAMGLPVPRSGNFADVYQFRGADGKTWALKCFTRKVAGLRERYAKIDEHLAKARLPFTVGFKFLEKGIQVRGEWYPLLKMEWVEGFTLNEFVARNLGKPHHLHALMQMWTKLAGRLRDANMAHADLQHGNVLLVPGATPQKLGLKLIDYDGMWVPALAGTRSGEVGHPNFQHPLRLKERIYTGEVDRFPHLVIAAGLRAALVGGKGVWDRFDNEDNLLFKEADLRNPGAAAVFKALWELNDPVLRVLVGHLALSAREPLRKTPWLDDVLLEAGGPRLSAEQEGKVCEVLGVTAAVPVRTAGAPPAVEQEFNVFQFLDDDDAPGPAAARSGGVRRPVSRRPAPKKSKAPLLIGGGALAGCLVVGAVIVVAMSGKRTPDPVPRDRPKDDEPAVVDAGRGGPPVAVPAGTGGAKVDEEPVVAAPPPVGPAGTPIAVAAIGGRDYLFIRQGDPAVYQTVNGSARKARVLGRHTGPVRALAAAADGSRAVTGGEDGEVRIWDLRAAAGAAAPGPTMTEKIAGPYKVGPAHFFAREYAVTVYQEGVRVRDAATGKEASVPAGPPGDYPVAGRFKDHLGLPGVAGRFGRPVSAAADLFDGAVRVQLFERGTMAEEPGKRGFWASEHGPRKPPAAAAPPGMTRRIARFARIADYKDKWAVDAYQEGIVVRDNASGREEVVPAGEPGHPVKEGFKSNLDNNPGLPARLGQAVTDEVKLFGGALTAQVFEGGVQLWDPAIGKTWFAYHARRRPMGADPGEAAAGPPPPTAVKGHAGAVLACAVSADGARAVTTGADRQLCEWDLAAGKVVRKFKVPELRAVAFLPDNRSVLLGSKEDSAGVWDLERQQPVTPLPGHKGAVRAVCVAPAGDLMFTAGEDGTVRVWAVPDGRAVASIPSDGTTVTALAVSPDGKILACGGPDGPVRFFDPRTGRPAGKYTGKAAPYALAFLPGGLNLVAARSPDPAVIRVTAPDAEAGPSPPAGTGGLRLVHEQDAGDPPPVRMGYRPDGKYLWLARRGAITVADGATGKEVKTWPVDGTVGHAAFGPGKELYVAFTGGKFQAWDWEAGRLLHDYDPAAMPRAPRPHEFWPAPEPNRLLVVTNSQYLLRWDTAVWAEADRLTPYPNESLTRPAPYPDGRRVAAVIPGRDGGRAVVWDVAGRKEAFRLDPVETRNLFRLEVSPAGRWVVGFAHDNGGQVFVWDGQTGKLRHTVPGIRTGNFGGGFSPDGDHFVYCEYAGRRWDVNLVDGKLTDASAGQKGSVAAATAPAAGLMASVDTDRKLRVWRFDGTATPAETARTPDPTPPTPAAPAPPAGKVGFLRDSAGLSGPAVTCAVSADGKKVFAATQNGTVHVLDVATGAETARLEVTKARPLHMVLVPKFIAPTNGVAIPERLHLLDDARHLHTWEADKGTKVRDVNLEKIGVPALSAGARLVVAPFESHVMVFEPDRAEAYSWVPGRWSTAAIPAALQRAPFNKATRAVGFSTDGSVGAAHAARRVLVWRVRGGKDIRTIDAAGSPGWVAVAADAGVVAAGDRGRLQAWAYDSGTEVMNVQNPHGILATYFAAATGTFLVTAGSDRSVRVWDLGTGKEAMRWPLDQAPAGVAVSADGRRAVVWYEEGDKVGLWALPEAKAKKP